MDNFTKHAGDPTQWNGSIMRLAILAGKPPDDFDTPENRALVEMAAKASETPVNIVDIYRRLVELAKGGTVTMSEAQVYEIVGQFRLKSDG